jgi:hypothetical protein
MNPLPVLFAGLQYRKIVFQVCRSSPKESKNLLDNSLLQNRPRNKPIYNFMYRRASFAGEPLAGKSLSEGGFLSVLTRLTGRVCNV